MRFVSKIYSQIKNIFGGKRNLPKLWVGWLLTKPIIVDIYVKQKERLGKKTRETAQQSVNWFDLKREGNDQCRETDSATRDWVGGLSWRCTRRGGAALRFDGNIDP